MFWDFWEGVGRLLFLSKFSKFSIVSRLTFFLEKESNKEKLFSFQILSLFEVRCRLRRLRSYFSRRSGFTSFCCSGLYEAFKGGFAARLIAPVLQGCDTKSFVSLTSLTLVHRPAAYAGYPPYPCATGPADYSLSSLNSLLFVMPSHTHTALPWYQAGWTSRCLFLLSDFAGQKTKVTQEFFENDEGVPPSPKAMAGQGRGRRKEPFLKRFFLLPLQ